MPKACRKPCSKSGCPNLTHSRFCETHEKQEEKRYDQSRKNDPERRFIQSRSWRAIRKAKLAENPLCERCYKKILAPNVRQITPAVLVHHIDGDQLNNEPENHESLCKNCHDEHHKDERWGK